MSSNISGLDRGDSYRLATSGRQSNHKLINKPKKLEVSDLKQELDIDVHRIPIEDLFENLETDPKTGITEEDARERLTLYGPNILTPVQSTPISIIYCKNLFGGFNLLLWIGSILCFIAFGIEGGSYPYASLPMRNLWMAIVLIAIVILSATFSFYQEFKSNKIMESFERLVPHKATVIRSGYTREILAEKLVVGDIITVKCGDRIPADIRIISATSFKVDNSSLTGESEAQVRSVEYTNENSLETKNLAFFSTNAVEGTCKGVVVNTGDSTVMGRIANLASGLEIGLTPIAKEINFFVYIITIISVILALIFIIAAFLLGYYWIDAIIYLIAIIIASVPEGLLATVTVCLTLTAKRMAKRNCLVKHLEAIETLGATKVICCDKTGTLTQNKMTVSHVFYDDMVYEVEMNDNELQGEIDTNKTGWRLLARSCMLCNHSNFLPSEQEDDGLILNRLCTGDSSESALLKFMEISVGDVEVFRQDNKKVYEMPFNSINKYQYSIHETNDGNEQFLLVMKGAPEKVLEQCSTVMIDEEERKMNDEWRALFYKNYDELGLLGERVIGFADTRLNEKLFPRGFDFEEEEFNVMNKELRFLGMISMVDPYRTTVPDAVAKCRTAGIKVIMVTGDHPITAKAVAKAVGIIDEGNKTVEDLAKERGVTVNDVDPKDARACVVHGNDLKEMSPESLDEVINHHSEIVFARTTPQQKLLIVESCQRLGDVVAVTGDGVNDSPALKKADIGIAMGISGSDVSKQSADMILLDDNFATIVIGVEEGRLIFDNLKKSIAYTLTSNIPEVIPFLLFIILGLPLPLGIITVLLIDLGTDMLPAISLAYEEAESDIMLRNPRDPKVDKLVTHSLLSMAYGQIGIMETVAAFFAYFIVMAENGFWPQRLVGLRQEWDSPAINDVMDSYGQEWGYKQRKQLEYTCQTAFFVAIVITQWANLLICKTRRISLFSQGMWNHYLTAAMFISATLTLIFTYVPGLNTALHTANLRFTWWLPALPYFFIILVYDEIRKFIIRRSKPNSWLERETYY